MGKTHPYAMVLEADLVIVNASLINIDYISLLFLSLTLRSSLREQIHLQRFQPFSTVRGTSMCGAFMLYSSVLLNINFKRCEKLHLRTIMKSRHVRHSFCC